MASWEQMTREEVDAKFPEEAAEWEKDPYTFAPSGGESGLAVTARALPALIELVRAHPRGNILVVSHKATIRLLLSSLLGFDPRRYRDNLDQSPAALNIVDFKDLIIKRLTLFNDTSHYAGGRGCPFPAVPAVCAAFPVVRERFDAQAIDLGPVNPKANHADILSPARDAREEPGNLLPGDGMPSAASHRDA